MSTTDRQSVRTAWLAGVLCMSHEVDFARYNRRFGRISRSYHRDLGLVRLAGINFSSQRNDRGHIVLIKAAL